MSFKKCLGWLVVSIACLLPEVLAFNANNRLVDYKDRIVIMNETVATSPVVLTMDLYSFPYITDVSVPLVTPYDGSCPVLTLSLIFRAVLKQQDGYG